jgi:hypothetical protein
MSAHGSFIRVIFLPCILLILRGGGVFLSLHELWLRHLRGEHVQGGGVAVQAADFVAENADRLTLCESAECAVTALTNTSDHRARDRIYILFVTYSSSADSYPTLYAGWIFEMFEYLDIHIIVYDLAHYLEREFPADLIASDEYYWVEDFNRCMVRLVDDMQPILSMEWCQPMWDLYKITFGLPTKNLVHMTIQEAPLCTNVCMLPSLRKLFGNTTPQVILHFNHERPWSQENIACDISELRTAYSSASLVLRNYYYADLDDAALYFPLGTGKLSFEKAIPSNGFTQGFPHRHSSERFLRCAFLGRMRYEDAVDSSGSQFQSGGDPPPLPPQEAERAMLMSTLQRLGCYYLGFDDVSRAVNMGTYASVLNSAVFAPCPGGNNPETFRHYEVRAYGHIYIIDMCIDARRIT